MAVDNQLTTPTQFATFFGGSGIFSTEQIQSALVLAEARVAGWLQTNLVPLQEVEEYPWPRDNRKVALRKVRLITVDQAEPLYANGSCDWQTSVPDECSTILQARESIIRIGDVWWRWCSQRWMPERMRITYTAGFTTAELAATTSMGFIIRAAIFNAAFGFLQTVTSLNSRGNVFIASYSAAGYSESRQAPQQSGAEDLQNEYIQQAKVMVRPYEVRRPISLRR